MAATAGEIEVSVAVGQRHEVGVKREPDSHGEFTAGITRGGVQACPVSERERTATASKLSGCSTGKILVSCDPTSVCEARLGGDTRSLATTFGIFF